MVFLYCCERQVPVNRPSDDGDVVLDVRAQPEILLNFTSALTKIGFESAGDSPDGHQHRWVRGGSHIDVLIPRHLGQRADKRTGGLRRYDDFDARRPAGARPFGGGRYRVHRRAGAYLPTFVDRGTRCKGGGVQRPGPRQASPRHRLRCSRIDDRGLRSNRGTVANARPELPRADDRGPRQEPNAMGGY